VAASPDGTPAGGGGPTVRSTGAPPPTRDRALGRLRPLRDIRPPGEPPFTRGSMPRATQPALDMRMFAGFGAARTRARFGRCSRPARPGSDRLRHADACTATTRTNQRRSEFGRAVSRSAPRRHGGPSCDPAARPDLDLDDDQLAGRPSWAMYIVRRGEAGFPRATLEGRPRTTSSWSSSAQRSSGSHPASSGSSRHDRIRDAELPEMEHGLDQRLSHREAGSTRSETRFTIADGMAYVEAALERGLRVANFAPRLKLLLQLHSDFFEESPSSGLAPDLVQLMSERLPRETSARPGCGSTPRPPACADAPAALKT